MLFSLHDKTIEFQRGKFSDSYFDSNSNYDRRRLDTMHRAYQEKHYYVYKSSLNEIKLSDKMQTLNLFAHTHDRYH